MRQHELKTRSEYFEAVLDGRKTFEIRRCTDRDFQVGDLLLLIEIADKDRNRFRFDLYENHGALYGDESTRLSPTGRTIARRVSYVLRGVPQYGLHPGFAILGLAPVDVADCSAPVPSFGLSLEPDA